MLSREDNALLTRVARGTPMSDTMRRYWIPALLAWELPDPDGPPVRVRLLGEDARVPCPARPARSALPDPEGGASVGYVIRFTITRRPPRSSPRRNPDAGRQQPQRAR